MPTKTSNDFAGLPAEALILQGLEDLAAQRESISSLLVQIGAPRLRLLEVSAPGMIEGSDPERRLYQLLCEEHGREAHSQFNSLIRQLVSFERGLERRVWSRQRRRAGGARCAG